MPDATVVCVDSDDDARAATVSVLRDELGGATVIPAESTAAALDVLDARDVDCVVTEYDLPDATGLDLVARVRVALHSVSTLLTYTDLRTVSRFVHTLCGRVSTTDGLGVFVVPATQDERAVNTVGQFCDGRVDVRETDDGSRQLRCRGLRGQPRWTAFGLDARDAE